MAEILVQLGLIVAVSVAMGVLFWSVNAFDTARIGGRRKAGKKGAGKKSDKKKLAVAVDVAEDVNDEPPVPPFVAVTETVPVTATEATAAPTVVAAAEETRRPTDAAHVTQWCTGTNVDGTPCGNPASGFFQNGRCHVHQQRGR